MHFVSDEIQAQTAATRRRRRWRRWLVTVIVVSVVLWWSGVRIYYYAWMTNFGTLPARHTDFSRLPRVPPPADATLAVIYRGLPHQYWQKRDLWRDLFTTSHRSIGGYRFYTTPAVVSEPLRSSVASAIRSRTLYQPYGGAKLCGGYHPDYCFEWHTSHGTFYALLCTGCHEMILIGDGTELHCDLNDGPFDALEQELKVLNKLDP
jgi:hypothetical protein